MRYELVAICNPAVYIGDVLKIGVTTKNIDAQMLPAQYNLHHMAKRECKYYYAVPSSRRTIMVIKKQPKKWPAILCNRTTLFCNIVLWF